MNTKRGFHFLDCLVALAALMLGATANVQLARKTAMALSRYEEQAVAQGILAGAIRQPVAALLSQSDRHFDNRGLACGAAGKFHLKIHVQDLNGAMRFDLVLVYRDLDEVEQTLAFQRLVWRGSDEGV